jgi:hypothetical protein
MKIAGGLHGANILLANEKATRGPKFFCLRCRMTRPNINELRLLSGDGFVPKWTRVFHLLAILPPHVGTIAIANFSCTGRCKRLGMG